MADEKPTAAEPKRSWETFLEMLGGLRHGEAARELTEELQAVIAASVRSGKAAKLQLTITVEPTETSDIVTLDISDGVKTTLPKPSRGSTLVYQRKDGSLTRMHPRQEELELKDPKVVKFDN